MIYLLLLTCSFASLPQAGKHPAIALKSAFSAPRNGIVAGHHL